MVRRNAARLDSRSNPNILDVLFSFFSLSYRPNSRIAQVRLIRSEPHMLADQPLEIRITRLLAQAVEQSGKPIAEIARAAGLKVFWSISVQPGSVPPASEASTDRAGRINAGSPAPRGQACA